MVNADRLGGQTGLMRDKIRAIDSPLQIHDMADHHFHISPVLLDAESLAQCSAATAVP